MSTTLSTSVKTLSYDLIKPVSGFASSRKFNPSYGVIQFNGADDIISEESYANSNEVIADMYNRITNLSENFEMINLYFPSDTQGRWMFNGRELRDVCKKANVVYQYNDLTGMWRFIPMDASVFQRVYEWQQVFQFVFYPECIIGTWNLDFSRVQYLAELGNCSCNRKPRQGVWIIEPWAMAEHVA